MVKKRNLINELDECQRHLTQLCADIEPEFLQLGRELESISRRAQDLSEQAKGAVYLEEGQHATAHLRKVTDLFLDVRDIFNTSLDALRTTIDESAKAVKHISGMGKELGGLSSGHRALEKLAMMTMMSGVSTRIESGRLGDKGGNFAFLSDQISHFSGALSGYAAAFETEVRQVLTNIAGAETSLATRLNTQRKEYVQSLEQITGALDTIDVASTRMAQLSEEVDHFTSRVFKEVGEIVSALQFQDITRQQIEHVQAALTEIGHSLTGKNLKRCRTKELRGIYSNLSVQLSQLRNVEKEIATAGQDIVAALKGIAREIKAHVSRVAEAIGESSGGEGRGALAMLGPQMEALGNQLKNSFLLSEALFETVSNVSGLVERIGSNQSKIDKTRTDMKMLALNAQVQAARLGSDGRALSVLAEDMQRLADSWSVTAGETASLLQNAVNLATDLEDRLKSVLEDCRSQTAASQGRASRAVLLLQTANQKTEGAVQTISQASQSLGEEITALAGAIKFPEIAGAGLEGIIRSLEGIKDEVGEGLPADERRQINGKVLETVSGRYTMESERAVHRNVLEQTDTGENAVPTALPTPKAGGAEDFGDNVELF
jgi:methyl-accepting chemotaxis protein